MSRTPHLALLRGINVGGKNIIAKEDLKQCFEDLGFADVSTYIQSGNILFRSTAAPIRQMTAAIEAGLSKRFSYDAQAVVWSRTKYRKAMRSIPEGWGTDESRKHNALFTIGRLTSSGFVSQLVDPKADFETVTAVPGVVFWSVSKENQGRSAYARLVKNSVYSQVTIRNHNTFLKLGALLDEY